MPADWFPIVERKDFTGKIGHLLETKIFGIIKLFRYRGFTFDDLEEATFVSDTSHWFFFHEFIYIGSTILFDLWDWMPETHDDVMDCKYEFTQAGFSGFIGFSDVM